MAWREDRSTGFIHFVRELDRQVPAPVLCIDDDARIRAAALPEGDVPGKEFEGRHLCDVVSLDGFLDDFLEQLRHSGHGVARLNGGHLSSASQTRAYVVRVGESRNLQSLEPRRDLLPGIIDDAPDPMFAMNHEFRIFKSNLACRELLGLRSEEIEQLELDSLFCDADEARRVMEALREESREPWRVRLAGGNGRPRDVELLPGALYGGGVDPRFWVIWLREIDGQKQETARREIERCVQSVAHDLRSPLTAVRGFARLVEQDFGALLGERGRRYLEQLLASTERMRGLVEELLELAVLTRGTGSLELLAPNLVLEPLAVELEQRLSERGIRLELPVRPPRVYANATRFYQVASNLISNAIDHMGRPDQPVIRVSIEAGPEATALIVADNGRGVPEADRASIFDAFTSLGSSPTHRGLGLAIVNRIVTAHGGTVSVRPNHPAGAVFRATFPNPC